jgi:ferrochelatase
VFTAHSIPVTMNDSSGPERNGLYLKQHLETARLVTEEVQGPGTASDLVFQSRSGPPHVPWLGPDINEHLESLAAHRVPGVVVCPTGFVSDHVEVIWDLDTEARATAQRLGLPFARAATAGTHPAFVAAIRELVQEQSAGLPPRRLGNLGLCGVDCPQGCCPASERPSA